MKSSRWLWQRWLSPRSSPALPVENDSGHITQLMPEKPRSRAAPRRTADNDATVAGITITHPDRVLWPDGGITKLELARYYAAVAPKLLAQAGNRPISLVRCPRGQGKQCFFQRHPGEGMASQVH